MANLFSHEDITPELLWALSFECNRHLIQFFDETDREHASLAEVAEYIAKHHSERYLSDAARVINSQHHRHLLDLAKTGVISYDAHGKNIRYRVDDTVSPEALRAIVRFGESDRHR